jgi:type I restriction enzyme R subunit
MSQTSHAERETQRRVIALLTTALGYEYLGNLSDQDNRNVLEGHLEQFLWSHQGFAERDDGQVLMRRAIVELTKLAGSADVLGGGAAVAVAARSASAMDSVGAMG